MVGKVFDRSNVIYVKNVPGKGRGVFANVPFKVGDIIERSPTWGFDNVAAGLIDSTGLFEYYFVRGDRKLKEDSITAYVVFGFMSLVNHSSRPNAKTVWTDEESGAWASIIAIKNIDADDEITHTYMNISDYPRAIKFIE
ncbi:SET domain-containing protein-lysine N-methyltransferase [Mesorhizobium sp. NZP2298]|uniref:SET domain-containing protein-lysine N-methyltransferase n=1 Tax=Mesorhizobium sp. NZP2298 TaxID=2483403 RepID=UPI001551E141|nr:SET domain-containing protein-lysine N-methyltransferase [Mesorhizobium sp. NZP2298]QKC98905.1 SET domain-containing protein-lysine N-methyltransferase [Mesorhizobium sp. NZP2298]